MALSKQLAGLVGPSLLTLSVTEAINIDIFSVQTPPVVYLNGTVLFVAGLALVRSHNRWRADWTILVTLSGWTALLLGLWRMVFPTAGQAHGGLATDLLLAGLFVVGAVMTIAAYRTGREQSPEETGKGRR